MTCLFCKIASGEVPGDIVYQDAEIIAFRDIAPQAPCHILVIPKRHITTLNDLEDGDADLMGRIVLRARAIAAQQGLAEDGYRLVINCNSEGGQTVYHIHLHILGGRQMQWPPG
ncbi:MAG TPA: histidine triad nucleotide-binding protein [Spongiibacteraceae bacterium]|nr:histidine triad nucleotide-binding protein [Spongiibacteraceae bacterium]HUH37617.1 histidine triad nucleotide-binding protein [Spongiibacteraceae bacterium]